MRSDGLQRQWTYRDVEAERPKLTPLLHDRVQEGERVEHCLPLRVTGCVKHVLVDPRIGILEASAHARRRLVRNLDGHLQQPDREADVRLGGDPQLEVLMDLVKLDL